MFSSDEDLSDAESRVIGATVREAMARRRMSRPALAHEARISLSTLEKALSGRRPFSLATTIRLEEALKVPLRGVIAVADRLAPEHLGAYSKAGIAWIEGDYLTLRPSFGEPGSVYAYRTVIRWDDTVSCLTFHESERLDDSFSQSGTVAVPSQSGHVYLVTNRHGQHRMAMLGRPTIAREMYGILTTLQAGRGAQLTPVATPLALVPLGSLRDPSPVFGRVTPGHPCHAGYRRQVDKVSADGFATFVS